MTAKVAYKSVEVGTELPAKSFPVTRAMLVQYAGASVTSTRSTGTRSSRVRSGCRM